MGNNNKSIDEYFLKLQNLEKRIIDSDNDDDDPELINELNNIINNLSKQSFDSDVKKSINAKLKFINLSNNPDPSFSKEGDSGFDIRAYIPFDVEIPAGKTRLIPTGLYFEVQKGLEVQIRSRSGLAANKGIFVLNSPGTVDCVTEDTLIKTPNGDITIKNIFESDERGVISFNEEDFKTEYDVIDDMWIVDDVECVKISTQNSSVTIPLTKEVYTKRGWIQSKDLLFDDEILLIN